MSLLPTKEDEAYARGMEDQAAMYAQLIRYDDLLAQLTDQYTEIKICYDERDGFFLKHESGFDIDSWVTMDDDLGARNETVAAAIKAAVEYHNTKCGGPHNWRRPISFNANE